MNALKNTDKYFPGLDGLRGLFCILILFCHFHFEYLQIPYIVGYLLLHSFFIMSAFLITNNLLNNKNRIISKKKYYKDFYIKRILRIFPVYYLYIGIILCIGIITFTTPLKAELGIIYETKFFGWMLPTFTYNFKDILCLVKDLDYKMSYAFPHLWTISLEEQFYFVIPTLALFLNKKRLKLLAILLIVLFPIIRIFGLMYLDSNVTDKFLASFIFVKTPFLQFDTFFYGVILAIINKKYFSKLKYILLVFIFVFIFSCVCSAWQLSNNTNKSFLDTLYSITFVYEGFQRYYYHTLINVVCFVLVYILITNDSLLKIFFKEKLVALGKISYGIYVYQYLFIIPTVLLLYPKLKLYIGTLASEIICAALCITALVIFANISYNKMELYFINLKKKFIKQ